MIVIVCTEDRGGMLFNNRRVSKDRTVIQKILELSEGKKLWIHPFSEKLFEQEHPENCCVDENFLEKAGEGDICFVENQSLKGMEGQIEKLIVFDGTGRIRLTLNWIWIWNRWKKRRKRNLPDILTKRSHAYSTGRKNVHEKERLKKRTERFLEKERA